MNQISISVIHSIPDGTDLIVNIVNRYPILHILSCKLYKRGLNDTYLMETGIEKYILRIYRRSWRSKEEIDFELEILTFLHDKNQPVAYPIARNDGNYTTEIIAPEGTRYIAIFSYAPGRIITNQKLTIEQSYNLGATLANIHAVLDDFKPSFNRPHLNSEFLFDWAMNAIKPLYENRKQDIIFLQQQIDKIKYQLEQFNLPLSTPIYGICVGDVHAGNAHFTEDNQPTLFDFDQCGYGWRGFDIAKYLHILIRQKIDVAVRNSFIDGYQSVRKLTTIELAAIPVFVKAAHIWVMGISANAVGDVLPYGWMQD
jgi:Ser/Thr protein kinase RdoA (MazF antagonist)